MKQITVDFSPFFIKCALTENDRLLELIALNPAEISLVGNIYAAKVIDIIKNQFAFVAIGEFKNGLLQLDDFRQRGLHNTSRGDRVLVQVLRDFSPGKGAMLSSQLTFSGRFLVLTKSLDNITQINVSNKITSKTERARLKKVCESLCPEGFGIIVRTESANASDEELQIEIEKLSAEAIKVIEEGKTASMPTLLYGNKKIYTRALKDLLDTGAKRIVTNNAEELDHIKEIAYEYANVTDVELSTNLCDIEKHMTRALQQKVWLKSGAYVLIEETDTCTYIDVNTGKFPGKKDPADTVDYVNHEAAKEIAAQIRLRNISGVIIVDFIGSHPDPDYESELMFVFKAALLEDRTPAVITDWSMLNVAMLTRKYSRASLKSTLTNTCSVCSGTGHMLSASFFADKIYKEIIKIYSRGFCGKIRVDAHEDIVKVLEKEPELHNLAQIRIAKDATKDFYEINGIS